MKTKLPLLSVVIVAYNEQQNLKRLFRSLKHQTYPKSRLDLILVDDASTDNTVALARQNHFRIIKVKTHDIELNKGIGMLAAKGEFICWLDADMELMVPDFFQLIVTPMINNPQIAGSFTREFAVDAKPKITNSFLRYISFDTFQLSPIHQFFSIPLADTFIEEHFDYTLCQFQPKHLPPVGRLIYRRQFLFKTAVSKNESFIDMEAIAIMTRRHYQLYAYVPQAKMRHYHAPNLIIFTRKYLRNLTRDYLPNIGHKHFTWINTDQPSEILRLIGWTIYVNLFFPELLRSLILALRYRDIAWLWQPVTALVVTDAIGWGFLSQAKGRQFLINLFTKF